MSNRKFSTGDKVIFQGKVTNVMGVSETIVDNVPYYHYHVNGRPLGIYSNIFPVNESDLLKTK